MTKTILESKTRSEPGKKLKKFRRAGIIPAVLYGRQIKSRPLWVKYENFARAYSQAGESTVLDLAIDGKSKVNVLIQDVQKDSFSGKFIHADFFQIKMGEKIEAQVPVEIKGEAPAVKELGGVLVKNIDEIPVSCFPADLPSKFEVDVSGLKTFDDYFLVKNLNASAQVKIKLDPEAIIALVKPPRSEEELAELSEKVEEDVTKVEGVEKKLPVESVESAEQETKSEK